jgi:hypothetical protein
LPKFRFSTITKACNFRILYVSVAQYFYSEWQDREEGVRYLVPGRTTVPGTGTGTSTVLVHANKNEKHVNNGY